MGCSGSNMNDPFYKQVKVVEDKMKEFKKVKESIIKMDVKSLASNPDEIQKKIKEIPEKGDEINPEIKKCEEILAEQKEKKDPEFSDFGNKDKKVANLKKRKEKECDFTEQDMAKMIENVMGKVMKGALFG